jgi:hypothetical protein
MVGRSANFRSAPGEPVSFECWVIVFALAALVCLLAWVIADPSHCEDERNEL